MRISRRALFAGLGVGGVVAVTAVANPNLFYTLITEDVLGDQISAVEAHQRALDGSITLIDIRRPDEWARTGIGEGAYRVDLRQDDFADVLANLVSGDRSAPIALICARGVRSARTANRLASAGFTNIIDVPEGMLGSAAGPGWIARDLPLNLDP